jgi:hypothetical protein
LRGNVPKAQGIILDNIGKRGEWNRVRLWRNIGRLTTNVWTRVIWHHQRNRCNRRNMRWDRRSMRGIRVRIRRGRRRRTGRYRLIRQEIYNRVLLIMYWSIVIPLVIKPISPPVKQEGNQLSATPKTKPEENTTQIEPLTPTDNIPITKIMYQLNARSERVGPKPPMNMRKLKPWFRM